MRLAAAANARSALLQSCSAPKTEDHAAGLKAQQFITHPFSWSGKGALHALDPVLEREHLLGHDLAGGLVVELAVGAEFGLRHADEDLGLGEPVHPEAVEDAAQVVLPPRAAERPSGRAQYGRGLV